MLVFWLVIATFSAVAIADYPFPKHIANVDDPIFRDTGANYRLPNDTHPETYELLLKTRVDAEDFDFSGHIKIGIVVDQPTRSIVLHTRKLTVENVTLARYNGTGSLPNSLDILPYTYDVVTEFLKITTNGIDLFAGDRLLLEIHYQSTLSLDRRGFYRSSYENTNGTLTWLAITHFEPTSARHAFPCYDEPARKAKFTISITHGKRYHALSNMPETRKENSDDTATTHFSQTPLISTYLIAFVISDFPYKTNTNTSGVFRHRIYSQPSKIESTTLGLNDGVRILSALENYLQVNFSLPKMDQLGDPYFIAGAMENWGLVLYQESNLLWDPKIHPFTRKYAVVTIISHEFGHQWFGNLVSPKFWQFIWLNEGFANLFEHIGTNLVYPDWKIFDLYVTGTMHSVLRLDTRATTRPMTFYAQTPAAIGKLFDMVAYAKSGSVLRMFLHAFTESSFKKGLVYYLTANTYNAVEESDLFVALEKAVKEDNTLDAELNVSDIFSSWSNQRGCPLITVQRNYNSNAITLQQQRYMSAETSDNDTATWWVPFNYATSASPNFDDTRASGWIRQNRKSELLNVSISPDDWIVLNKQQTALYRVLYDERNYRLIAKQLNSDKYAAIHVLSRSQLLNDLVEFFHVGRVNIDILLEFLSYLHRETEYAPWVTARRALSELSELMSSHEHYQRFRSFAANLTHNFFKSIGSEDVLNESMLNKFARQEALLVACKFRLSACLDATRSILAQSLRSNSSLPLNTYDIIYEQGARIASDADLELLWKRLFETTIEIEGFYISTGLGLIENVETLEKYLKRTVQKYSEEPLYEKWREKLFSQALENGPHSLQTCIRFIRNSSADIIKYYKKVRLNDLVTRISSKNIADDTRIEFENLLVVLLKKDQITEATAKTARDNLKAKAIAFNVHKASIDKWFGTPTSHHGTNSTSNSSGHSSHSPIISYQLLSIVFVVLLINKKFLIA